MNEIIKPETIASRFLQVANETSASKLGRILKFNKGKFFIGNDDVTGRECIALMTELVRGRAKFSDGKVVAQRLGKVADGFKWPEREELDDLDQKTWEIDSRGERRDPWSEKQFYLPMRDLETGVDAVFITASQGGRDAIGRLCDIYGRNFLNGLPIIKLDHTSYKHREFGHIDQPDFPIMGWEAAPTVPIAPVAMPVAAAPKTKKVAAANGDMDDEIPF
jgi:hypothetical protein